MSEFENESITEETKAPENMNLPLPIELGIEKSGNGDPAGQPSHPRKKLLPKIAYAAVSVLFCGVAILFMIVQTVESVDRLTAGRAIELEVLGAVAVKEDAAPAVSESAPSETEVESASDTVESLPEDGVIRYPIEYESLANYDLLNDMSNETAFAPDMATLIKKAKGVGLCKQIYEKYGDDAPVVLIVHTHGTEAYAAEGADTYTELDSFRTNDTEQNVVAVGDVIENILSSQGINVIHCREMFDAESYRESYSRSYAAVAEYLKKYPSISYVLDVHRDSVFREDRTNIATLANLGGTKLAQVMIVVGTDEGGADHKGWEDNLSLALNVQKNLAAYCGEVPRKVNLRSAAFNQGLCPGSLLLEIGSCGNTLTEAKRAAVIAALSLGEAMLGEEIDVDPAEAVAQFAP